MVIHDTAFIAWCYKESDGTPLYLDELDPNRGDMNTEIFPDCGIMCYLAQK